MKVLCLDLDDCILPWSSYNLDYNNFSKEIQKQELLKNLILIQQFCKKNDVKIILTSSWSLIIDPKTFLIKKEYYDNYERILWNNLIYPIIKDYLIDIDEYTDRVKKIKKLQGQKEISLIFILDDMNLEFLENEKTFFYRLINGKELKEKLNDMERIIKLYKK